MDGGVHAIVVPYFFGASKNSERGGHQDRQAVCLGDSAIYSQSQQNTRQCHMLAARNSRVAFDRVGLDPKKSAVGEKLRSLARGITGWSPAA